MPLIKIGEALYTDGGIRHVALIRAAIDLGADEIICIVCQAGRLDAAFFDAGDLFKLGERLMDIVTNELVANDFESLKMRSDALELAPPPGSRQVMVRPVIRPPSTVNVDMRTFTVRDIADMIDTGHTVAKKALGVRAVGVTLTVA
jgi:NTE family protein